MSKRDAHRDLLTELGARGLLEYGSVIDTTTVHNILGIVMPMVASKAEFDRIAMQELAAIDYCRNVLLGQGKYLMGTNTGYRILLPSENKSQIDAYMSSADRKLSRALKLSRNSPSEADTQPDQTAARILMKRSGMRHQVSQPHQGVSL